MASGSQEAAQPLPVPTQMFMGQVGRLKEFDESKEDFPCYIERMEYFFEANAWPEDKRAVCFLSVIGASTYRLLRDLVSPEAPGDKSYAELKEKLMNYYKPKPSVIAERFKFHKRNQRPDESVSAYVVQIKKLAEYCEFGAFLEEALRDRLVCGLSTSNRKIQEKLIAEKELTFQKACEKAVQWEMAEKDSREMRGSADSVFRISRNNNRSSEKASIAKHDQEKGRKFGKIKPCFRCNQQHSPETCKFKEAKCFGCGRLGHIAKACRKKSKQKQTQFVEAEFTESEEMGIFTLSRGNGDSSLKIPVNINGNSLIMEIDTGAEVSLVSEAEYRRALPHLKLKPSNTKLKTYSGETVPVLGEADVHVEYQGQTAVLPVIVVSGDKPCLFGRNWLKSFKLNWKAIFSVNTPEKGVPKSKPPELQELLTQNADLFKEELGTLKKFKAHIYVRKEAQPKFFKPRPVPYAIRDGVEQELKRLERDGIIYPVSQSHWAAPIVVVPKKNGEHRVCGDYKVTINQAADTEQYPLPTPEDLFAKMSGGKVFTKIDLRHAYQQCLLDEESQEFATINTHKGLYRYRRLPFGVASAPAIFQRTMEQILQGLEYTVCRLDDILVSGRSEAEHLTILAEVFRRLREHGLRLNLSKCWFFQEGVEFLGHWLSAKGLKPLTQKLEAIVNAPAPTNVTELRAYLGLLNYYGKFIRNLSTVLHPLHELLKSTTAWKWSKECQEAFESSKRLLTNSEILVHYDPKLKLTLACDASPYGVGAVLSHVTDDEEEKPVAFASRTLTTSEKNYAQIEKEALAIIFGVKRFHQYLYGRTFSLITDHKPLITILGPKTGIPTLAAARMQRWAIILSAYQYTIEYRRSSDHGNADALSRLPEQSTSDVDEAEVFNFTVLDEMPITARDISQATSQDPILSKVWEFTMNGWPSYLEDENLKPYFTRKQELSAEQGCLLWGLRVIIPPKFRERLLEELHEEHLGICRMKAYARGYMWWPKMDEDIEQKAKGCDTCSAVACERLSRFRVGRGGGGRGRGGKESLPARYCLLELRP